ncbi:MAG: hypothetical protein V9819_00545 [Candidatus Dasytiphilus stammeri]
MRCISPQEGNIYIERWLCDAKQWENIFLSLDQSSDFLQLKIKVKINYIVSIL